MPKLPTHPRTPQGLPVSPAGGPQDTRKHLLGPIQELRGTARNSRVQALGTSAPQGAQWSVPSGACERPGGLRGPLMSAQKLPDPPWGAREVALGS